MKRKNSAYGLGVFAKNQNVYLFYNTDKKDGKLRVDVASDGFTFATHKATATISDDDKKTVDITTISDLRVSMVNKKYYMTYKVWSGEDAYVFAATSSDLSKWKTVGQLKLGEGGVGMGKLTQTGMVVSEYSWKRKRVMYYGDDDIKVATSVDLTVWNPLETPVLSKRSGFFDNAPLKVASVFDTDKGIILIYYVQGIVNGADVYSVGSAMFDRNDPRKLLYRTESPLLTNVEGLANKPIYPIGVVNRDDMVISYWDVEGEGVVAVAHPLMRPNGVEKQSTFKLVLEKLKANPILKPITEHMWESKAVFNPAAIYENGKVHLIYRAVGDTDCSMLGYATSTDGVTIDERLDEPIYIPRKNWEGLQKNGGPGYPGLFASGSAYGGVEDPRITRVEDKYVMTYVAYDGWGPPRVALTSISVEDFQNRKWDQWKEPVLISRPGVVNKNACVFPEKINGKYCIFHRIFPNMLIDYVDSLDFDGSTYLRGDAYIAPRAKMWDSRKIGVGAPPIKTKYGWLMIYQAVGDADPSRYKMGAMLLDLNNPAKVLFRTKHPILWPDQPYENEGLKFGVAYPCGAIDKDGTLMVYYGGADMVVCAAQAPMEDFLQQLMATEEAQLNTVKHLQLSAR